MPSYDRFHPERESRRERGYRDPRFGGRGNGQRDDDDDRGAWMSRDRDFFEREFRRDPYEPRDWFREAREPFERFERDRERSERDREREGDPRDYWRERRRPFEPFEDWQRPVELSGARGYGRSFGDADPRRGGYEPARGGYEPRGGYGSYGHPGAYGGYAPGRYAGRGPKGYQRSDERLRDEVCERLTAHPDVDASEMTVAAENGEITLEGTVPTRAMKRMAEECAEDVFGVREVHNRLRIGSPAETQRGFGEGESGRGREAH